jgi:oligoribonuclease
VLDRLVWIDCEMTGLDLTRDALVEVAVVVTDGELTLLDDGLDLVIATPAEALATMPDVVREMHTSSGLLNEIAAATLSMADAEEQLLEYIRQWVPDAGKAPLCGNSIGTDRTFLARDMPKLESHMHYRMVDVSSIKELARRWYPRTYYKAPAKQGGHRALADIKESIDELRYYRATVFVTPPGPDAEKATAIAAAIVGTPTPETTPDAGATTSAE